MTAKDEQAKPVPSAVCERAALKAQPSGVVLSDASLTLAVDAAMLEMQNISPPLRRSDCERLIRAALSSPTYRAYTTTPGEAVAGIALRQLGDESRWVEIRDLNAHAFPDIGPNDYYPVGTELRLPALSAPSHGEQVRQVVPEGWAVRQVSDDGDVGFVVGAPRDEAGVRASTSVWEGDSDPAHLLLWHMLAATPSAPSHGEQVLEGWQLVPVEPTDAMLEAGDKYIGTPATYKAMLSACPSPAITKDFSQFLSAVMDAAGLIRHGRQSKELSEYLGMKCMEYRGATPSAGSQEQG